VSASRRRCAVCRERLEPAATGRPRRFCSPACRQAAYRKRHRALRGTLEVMGSSRSDEWPTDPAYFAKLEARFGPFDLDPCATAETAKAPVFFTRADDGLAQEWRGRVFMNPPYGRHGGGIAAWMRKAFEAAQSTAELVVCLVPARAETAWWHDYAMRGEIEYIRGRLKFGPCTNPAPFASALVVFRNARRVTEVASWA
jgi:phage N-6-adenine-methyltransferase